MDKWEIDMAAISVLPQEMKCVPELFRQCNIDCHSYMREYKGRIMGYAFVNPGYAREAVEEIQRCFDIGMIGVKLYHSYFIDDPAVYPVIEKAIELGIPILLHAGVSYQEALVRQQSHLSGPLNILNVLKTYPEAIIIEGHIGGGGDWENVIEGLKLDSRIYADTSGSVVDEWLIDTAVEELGAERLLYANDCSFCEGVAKILSADLTPGQRQKIFHENFENILEHRKGGSLI